MPDAGGGDASRQDAVAASEAGTFRDAGSSVDGTGDAEAGIGSRCTMTATNVACTSQQLTEATSSGTRVVVYELPLGTPPAAGWPVVINFQATDVAPSYAFVANASDLYGAYYQAALTKNLLDAGYAVLAPTALTTVGSSYWETNIAPYATSWSGTGDDELVQMMLTDVAAGAYGRLDATSLYATGLSSGGYMTSRMALSYPGKFKALAIESASWATCLSGAGPSGSGVCTVPSPLPAMHPPTLLLHGDLDTEIVPEWTVTDYVSALTGSAVPEKEVDDPNSGHQWIPEAPAEVLAWFKAYP